MFSYRNDFNVASANTAIRSTVFNTSEYLSGMVAGQGIDNKLTKDMELGSTGLVNAPGLGQ